MAASLSDLKKQIESAERIVSAADARAASAARSLKAHWRARGPTILIGAASTLLAWQLLRGRPRGRRQAFAPRGSSWMRTLEPVLRQLAPRLITTITALVAGLLAKKSKKPLVTAPAVDLGRYAGTWYEIARLPEKYEKDCASDATATYETTTDGGLRVINRCRRRDGSVKRAIGRAEVTDADSNAKLRVSFAPQLLDPLPFVWGDYYIMDVASDYSTAVVGTPDRTHLWLLARQPTVSEDVRSAFIAKALGQGFDTSQLIYGRHTGSKGYADTVSATSSSSAAEAATAAVAGSAAAPSSIADIDPQTTVPPTDYDRVTVRQGEKQS